jgi:hypothetical protein
MMPTAAELEESVASTLVIAHDWKAKGNVRSELSCLGSALHTLLTVAVAEHDTVESGVAYLHARHGEELLERYYALNAGLLQSFAQGSREASVDNEVTFTHICWLLGQHTLGDALLMIVCNSEIAKLWPHTKFWTEYHRAMACLVSRTPYVPQRPPKLKGYEKCWAPYLDLVAALTSGGHPAAELAACRTSFTRRNRDKRLTDYRQHDGDGRMPVRWDFRVTSILARWHAANG